jgi:hypothetical protein
LGDIESGIRQLIRNRPLEVTEVSLPSGHVLRHIDVYYSDQRGPEAQDVATQLARQLADPRPADSRTIQQLDRYKDLDARWADWSNVAGVCRSLAAEMVQ